MPLLTLAAGALGEQPLQLSHLPGGIRDSAELMSRPASATESKGQRALHQDII